MRSLKTFNMLNILLNICFSYQTTSVVPSAQPDLSRVLVFVRTCIPLFAVESGQLWLRCSSSSMLFEIWVLAIMCYSCGASPETYCIYDNVHLSKCDCFRPYDENDFPLPMISYSSSSVYSCLFSQISRTFQLADTLHTEKFGLVSF